MNVSLDEHRLGGLRWIVLRGPDREAFRALGEHMREEMAALAETWGLVGKLRQHVSGPPGRERLASVRQASERYFPEAWAELAAFAEGSAVPFDDLSLMNFRGDLGLVTGGIGCSDLAWRRERSLIGHNEDGAAENVGQCALLTLALEGLPTVTAFWSARTLDEAVDYLKTHPSAGGFAYTIGDETGQIVNVEAMAGRHAAVEPGAESGPLLWHTNHGRYLPGAEPAPGGTSVARGQTLGALAVPEQDPDPAWFLRVLADDPLPVGVRRDHEGGDQAITLCTFIADLTAGVAVFAARDEQPVAIPLLDLAEGRPDRQREFARVRER
jgi:Acyl-coenzyme A:6-aminopenicillanic acid acyl-transferase